MSAPQSPALDALFVFWQHTLISRYSAVSGIAFYAWDFCITIQDEIEYFWKSPWSFIKFLYLLVVLLPIPVTWTMANVKAESIFPDSVPNKFLSTVLGVLCGMQVVAAMSLIGLDFRYVYANYPKPLSDLPTLITTCSAPIPPFFFALGIPYIIFDFILFALATSRSFLVHLAIPAETRSSKMLIIIMLRDSILVFVIAFLLSVANILTWEYGPHDLYGLVVFWTPLMPGVFANHMLINLRKIGRLGLGSETSGVMTTVRFGAHDQTGNLVSHSAFSPANESNLLLMGVLPVSYGKRCVILDTSG
ncbi:hypothetical protein BD779DRAFT_1675055 [Infundibulicybe gibba]|nr:hypothetical protein BD779DRAFT_1675055 [Infundibulicybe gibba]